MLLSNTCRETVFPACVDWPVHLSHGQVPHGGSHSATELTFGMVNLIGYGSRTWCCTEAFEVHAAAVRAALTLFTC